MANHAMRERRKRHERRRRQIRLFTEAVRFGAVVIAPPHVVNAIQRDSTLVAGISSMGVDVYSNPHVPPDMIVAIAPDYAFPILNDPLFPLEMVDMPYRFKILR